MEPFEVMVSESQERMLCVVEPANVDAVIAVCEKWEVSGAAIGSVTDAQRMRVLARGELVGDMPVRALVDDCPLYDVHPEKPARPLYDPPAATLAADATPQQALLALLSSPNIASRRPLFEQYDAIVQSRTVRRPEQADAAVLALADGSALAVSIDGSGRRVACDPYWGTVAAVLECASNLACVGAEPLGTTNNLNFGNPEKGHIAWQLTESVRGLGDACRALEAPIVGGNVSLYNEGATGPIYPTPVIGMVGRLPDARRAGRLGFRHAGEQVALVGPFIPSLRASELAKLRGEPLPDGLQEIDIEAVRGAQHAVADAVRTGALSSAHDIAEGGLAVALAECCLASGIGAEIDLGDDLLGPAGSALAAGGVSTGPHSTPLSALFGEGAGGFLVSGAARWPARPGGAYRRARDRGGRWRRVADRRSRAGRDRLADRCPARRAGEGARRTGGPVPMSGRSGEACEGGASVNRAMAGAGATRPGLEGRDGPRDECGVFGLYAPGHEVSRLSYFALYALQHRGQESAGIAAADRGGHIITRRELGLVSQVFSENDLRTLAGELAIGHVRYSTTGSNAWENSQPVQRSEGTDGSRREVALAHNGNLINAVELHDELVGAGSHVQLDLRLGDHRRADRHTPR